MSILFVYISQSHLIEIDVMYTYVTQGHALTTFLKTHMQQTLMKTQMLSAPSHQARSF